MVWQYHILLLLDSKIQLGKWTSKWSTIKNLTFKQCYQRSNLLLIIFKAEKLKGFTFQLLSFTLIWHKEEYLVTNLQHDTTEHQRLLPDLHGHKIYGYAANTVYKILIGLTEVTWSLILTNEIFLSESRSCRIHIFIIQVIHGLLILF